MCLFLNIDIGNGTDEHALFSKRLIYVSTKVESGSPSVKTNHWEAKWIAEIFAKWREYGLLDQTDPSPSIGIITPYRAQIALIIKTLHHAGMSTEGITVDTVERYQGGAKDIVILSLCMNSERQLRSLVSRSSSGVDRKLNVAMTRARKQVIVLGNDQIISKDSNYRALIEYIDQHPSGAVLEHAGML